MTEQQSRGERGRGRFRVGFCVSGQGQLFRSAAETKTRLGIDPALLVTSPQASADLEAYCADAGIAFARLDPSDLSSFHARITTLCREARLDLLVLTYDHILPPELVQLYRGRIVNVHMALLPAFRGKLALRRALGADVRFAGATIHVVNEEIDRGPIIAQCVVPTFPDDDEEALGGRIYPELRRMYLQVIGWYAEGRVVLQGGRARVRDARYGEPSISPSIERDFGADG